MSARSFCTVSASTLRNPAAVGGRTGAAVTYLIGLLITPLWPVSPDMVRQLGLQSLREKKQCFYVPADGADLPDIKEGDILVVAGVSYPVFFVSEWVDNDVPCLDIIVSELKRNAS